MKKVSIITAVYNGEKTIENTIMSVLTQDYENIEYIIIDGGSSDSTMEIINRYRNKIGHIISERDDGIYFAMNKGLKLASGDVIGILNSDDLYASEQVISTVVNSIDKAAVDGVYGDLIYVDRLDTSRIIRYWKAGSYLKKKFRWGWMPPHPTVFLKRDVYKKYGVFNTKFTCAADYEFLLRIMYRNNVILNYIPKILIRMRVGGKSNVNLGNRIKANMEDLKAWKINGLNPNLFTTVLKPLFKIKQYWQRPVNN